MCPFLEALPALLSCSGHSGSGKTEAAKKMVQFLHSLEWEQRKRGCRVRGSSPCPGVQEVPSHSSGPGEWSSGLWLLLGGSPRHGLLRGRVGWGNRPLRGPTEPHILSSSGMPHSGLLRPEILECPLRPPSWTPCCPCSAVLAMLRQSSTPMPAASARSWASACSSAWSS